MFWALCLISIFLLNVSIVSAFEFDNVKTYDSTTRIYTIENWFGLGGKLAEIRLNSELKVIVPRGYQKVAEFELYNFKKDYSNAFKDMNFYDANDLSKELTRSFDYKYLDYEFKDKKIYGKVCVENKLNNSVSCHQEEIRTEKVLTPVWIKFSDINELPNDNKFTIGIFTEVLAGDRVEWIPTLFGERLTEWASWTESLNTNIDQYWAFEDNNANTTVHAQVGTNGVLSGGNTEDKSVSAKVNLGFDLDGSGDYVTITDGFDIGADWSLNLWLNADAIALQQNYFDMTGQTVQLILSDGTADGKTRVLVDGVIDFKSTTGIAAGSWYMLTLTHDQGVSTKFYINGLLNGSASGSASGSTTQITIGNYAGNKPFAGPMDEVGIWTRLLSQAEVTQLYNEGTGLSYTDVFDQNPNITLNSPPPTNYTAAQNIQFNFTAWDDFNLTSVRFYVDGILNKTNATGINNSVYLFNLTLGDGDYSINGVATDNSSFTGNSSIVRIVIDSVAPVINITNPIQNEIILSNSTVYNVTIEWEITESNLDSCWLNNGTVNISLVCANNQTGINFNEGNNSFIFYANDTFGFESSVNRSFFLNYIRENVTYDNPVIEGEPTTITFNITATNITTILANLTYNNTVYQMTETYNNGTYAIFEREVIPPLVSSDTNVSFEINYSINTFDFNLSGYKQLVQTLSLDNCSAYTNKIINLTLYDEELQTLIVNGTEIEISVNIYNTERNQTLLNLSNKYLSNSVDVCLNINLTSDYNYFLDTIIRYSATGYANEYYNIVNLTLNNETPQQNIILYDLNESDSTEFQITFTGSDFTPVEDVLIYIDRQYISENNFKTVELPETDSNGQTIVHLVRNDIIYNIRAVKGGVELGRFLNIIAFCQDYTIGSCAIPLNAISNITIAPNYDEEFGLIYDSPPEFNDTTNTMSFDFTSSDGSVKTVFMNVERNDIFGNRSICNNTVTTTSGTVSCNIGTGITDTNLVTIISINDEVWTINNIPIDDSGYGNIGYVIWFVLSVMLLLMFGDSKNGVLFSIIFSFIGAVSLGIAVGGITGIGSAGIWLLIIVIIGIWEVNKNRRN